MRNAWKLILLELLVRLAKMRGMPEHEWKDNEAGNCCTAPGEDPV